MSDSAMKKDLVAEHPVRAFQGNDLFGDIVLFAESPKADVVQLPPMLGLPAGAMRQRSQQAWFDLPPTRFVQDGEELRTVDEAKNERWFVVDHTEGVRVFGLWSDRKATPAQEDQKR